MSPCQTSVFRTARQSPWLGALAISLVLLSGCATTQGDPDAVSYDPLEPMNRKVHSFNMALDKVALKPLAKGYKMVVPSPIRKGVTNFFSNLTTPRSALNNFCSNTCQSRQIPRTDGISRRQFALPRIFVTLKLLSF